MCTRLSTPQVEKSFSVIKSVTDNLEVDIADADEEGIEYGISSELGSMETCYGHVHVLDMQATQTKTPLTITQSRTDGEIEQVCVPDRLACVVVT